MLSFVWVEMEHKPLLKIKKPPSFVRPRKKAGETAGLRGVSFALMISRIVIPSLVCLLLLFFCSAFVLLLLCAAAVIILFLRSLPSLRFDTVL